MLILRVANVEHDGTISIPLKTLMEQFECARMQKISDILKSLNDKGYIQIIKVRGIMNRYRITVDYLKKGLDNSLDLPKNEEKSTIQNVSTCKNVSTTTQQNVSGTTIQNVCGSTLQNVSTYKLDGSSTLQNVSSEDIENNCKPLELSLIHI